MTRPEKISRRKAFNKALRARAAEEQTSFVSVLQRVQNVEGTRTYRSKLNLPTHPHRPARRNMMGDQLRQHKGQGHDRTTTFEVPERKDENEKFVERKTVIVDLMAMAKPAKVKGVAKEFEVVKRIRDVIVLEDQDFDSEPSEDEWEPIDYDDFLAATKRTYSAALRGR